MVQHQAASWPGPWARLLLLAVAVTAVAVAADVPAADEAELVAAVEPLDAPFQATPAPSGTTGECYCK